MSPTERLEELFLKFPGIGPKQAARFVYFLLRENTDYKTDLAKNIEYLKDTSYICQTCLRVFSQIDNKNKKLFCEICLNKNRDNAKLMIVIKDLDIESIEKTNLYDGKYFILGNILPFFTDKPSQIINIKELTNLISKNINQNINSPIQEIIFALPSTDEGENTIDYLKKTLTQINGIEKIKMSTLARGLSTGLEIEYIDKNTFKQAFNHRE